MNKKKPLAVLPLAALACVIAGGSAFAFSDVKNDAGQAQIMDLKNRGIVQGIGNDLFKPRAQVNGATAVTLIVKGLGLNIDTIRFVKKPEASDYFTKVKDNAPYAGEFIIAQFNGLDIPKDLDPSKPVTREQFAYWLMNGIASKGDYAFTDQFIILKDQDQVTSAYSSNIQKLLISGIASLDAKGDFRPKDVITRSEAAVMVDKAIEFVENTKPIPPVETPAPSHLTDVKLASESIADGVLKVTVTATAPNPGYGVEISNIAFRDGEAVIDYREIEPDPDKMYPQYVAQVQAVTYLSSDYKPVLGQIESTGAATPASPGEPSASGSTGFPIEE
ncbi:S-layer homology domain-containing protein [Cohnella zeiphila]|uniref:S-layer homology domain-containing protein n=1 Tax=Cohnella zeiphila TaxID=2761120 RepID=A0A7X0SGK4_9BACL|nr:S-layer homology domain-containing protein [Cohnella zeiphila]MBB6729568.1 S-layer homology domain-containing protein [Cohnella zeiphila]